MVLGKALSGVVPISGLVPARETVSLAVTVTLPPPPGPEVLPLIRAPSVTSTRGAVTTILPAAPARCGPFGVCKNAAGRDGVSRGSASQGDGVSGRHRDAAPRSRPKVLLLIRAPSVTSTRCAVTAILPAAPGPKVLLMIRALSVTSTRGAVTAILPAAPAPAAVPSALAKMPLRRRRDSEQCQPGRWCRWPSP